MDRIGVSPKLLLDRANRLSVAGGLCRIIYRGRRVGLVQRQEICVGDGRGGDAEG